VKRTQIRSITWISTLGVHEVTVPKWGLSWTKLSFNFTPKRKMCMLQRKAQMMMMMMMTTTKAIHFLNTARKFSQF